MITVRPIVEPDIPGFRLALDSVCRERRFLARMQAPPPEDVRRFVLENLQRGAPQFVADEAGRIVGWCDTLPGDASQGTPHIGRLGMGVIASHRGRGLGFQLAEATLARARDQGLEKIELCVYSSNLRAIALYRKLGFKDEGRRVRGRLVDGIYDDVLQMALHFEQTGAETVSTTR